MAKFKSGDVDGAIGLLREMKTEARIELFDGLTGTFVGPLEKEGRWKELNELAAAAVLPAPHSTSRTTSNQMVRVRCLLELKRPAEALAAAKSAYNLCTMSQTSEVLALFNQALAAAHPRDKDLLARFTQEQVDGANLLPNPTAPPLKSTVLLTVKADGKEYVQAIEQATKEDYPGLMARGNLLLLADRVAEAKDALEQAYRVAPQAQINEASENLARVMKAQDGTIGRANTWVLSIRPKPASQPAQ
jgi:tetratricopeptide (TPR) repeat protein